MKILRWFVCVLLIILLLAPISVTDASSNEFGDINGHWAEYIMRWAYDEGLINGVGGRLHPDENITAAQALTIICRVLGAEISSDISETGLDSEIWYYEYAAKAVYLGLIEPADTVNLDRLITRQDAFALIGEAFQLTQVDPDMSLLERYSDSGLISRENRQTLGSMISQELIFGDGDTLRVNDNTTRAAFLSVLYRIIGIISPASTVKGDFVAGVMLRGRASLSGSSFSSGVWFDCGSSEISLDGVTADSAVIRSHLLETLAIGESANIGSLTLATQAGNITVSPDQGAVVDTIVVGSGTGSVKVKGINVIEVTGNDRQVIINGVADTVVVSGQNCVISVPPGAKVGKVTLLMNALGSEVISNGMVNDVEIMCINGKISGSGYVDTLKTRRADTKVSVTYTKLVENIDIGLLGASVAIDAPKTLPAGDVLSVSASVGNAAPGAVCDLLWYLDGEPVLEESVVIGKELPKLTKKFEYNHETPESVDVMVELKYVTAMGEKQEISASSTVKLENYDIQYWIEHDSARILEKVTLGYLGDFTLQWAIDNDLESFEKEVWINAKGYTSKTEYLLWVNLAYQRVNIFKRANGYWELIRSCIVGTGAPGSGSPVGVWTTSFKQVDGWTTSSYTVKPVVRFREATGYAFHSRLYYPNSSTLQDESIGFPISHGCVRMYDEDIWYIYDNVPDGTTVVVY